MNQQDLKRHLGLPETATTAQVRETLRGFGRAVRTGLGLPETATSAHCREVLSMLGLPSSASPAAIRETAATRAAALGLPSTSTPLTVVQAMASRGGAPAPGGVAPPADPAKLAVGQVVAAAGVDDHLAASRAAIARDTYLESKVIDGTIHRDALSAFRMAYDGGEAATRAALDRMTATATSRIPVIQRGAGSPTPAADGGLQKVIDSIGLSSGRDQG